MLRESGHEHFNGSLVVPVITPAGEIAEAYGRKILPAAKLRAGTLLSLAASAETAPLLAEIPPPSRRNGAVVAAVRN